MIVVALQEEEEKTKKKKKKEEEEEKKKKKKKKKKEYCFKSIFQTSVFSCMVRQDLRTYLLMFYQNSWFSELIFCKKKWQDSTSL